MKTVAIQKKSSIQNVRMLTSSTGGIGEPANFIMGSSFVAAAGLIRKFHKAKKMAMIACLIASVVTGIAAAIVNYFILLPLQFTEWHRYQHCHHAAL